MREFTEEEDRHFAARAAVAVGRLKDFSRSDLEYDEDWAEDAQVTIQDCMDILDFSLEMEADIPSTPSGSPYCGCPTCVLRETLYMMTVLVARGVRDGKVRLGGDA